MVDTVPFFVLHGHACQGWRCDEKATWNRWAGFYCTNHAIMAGWLPGPVRWPGTQLEMVA